jgi:hypothetical protein
MPPQDAKVAIEKYKAKRKEKDLWLLYIIIILKNSSKNNHKFYLTSDLHKASNSLAK